MTQSLTPAALTHTSATGLTGLTWEGPSDSILADSAGVQAALLELDQPLHVVSNSQG